MHMVGTTPKYKKVTMQEMEPTQGKEGNLVVGTHAENWTHAVNVGTLWWG